MSGIPAGAGSLIGKRLGKYEILALLALGGTAEIYLARIGGTAGFEKYVVVKCLHDHLADDPDFVKMFLDEARISALFDHSNVVQTFERRPEVVENMGYKEFYPVETMDKEGFQKANYFGYEDDIMLEPSRKWLEEKGKNGMANTTSWHENCETSAIGRALANIWSLEAGDARKTQPDSSSTTSLFLLFMASFLFLGFRCSCRACRGRGVMTTQPVAHDGDRAALPVASLRPSSLVAAGSMSVAGTAGRAGPILAAPLHRGLGPPRYVAHAYGEVPGLAVFEPVFQRLCHGRKGKFVPRDLVLGEQAALD